MTHEPTRAELEQWRARLASHAAYVRDTAASTVRIISGTPLENLNALAMADLAAALAGAVSALHSCRFSSDGPPAPAAGQSEQVQSLDREAFAVIQQAAVSLNGLVCVYNNEYPHLPPLPALQRAIALSELMTIANELRKLWGTLLNPQLPPPEPLQSSKN